MQHKIYQATLEWITQITPTVISVRFKIPQTERFTFQAGQYVQIFLPNGHEEICKPFSIASPPSENGTMELCMKQPYPENLIEGKTYKIIGPLGTFTLENPEHSDLLFVAMGTGIAPFRSMISALFRGRFNKEIWLIFGVRHEDEILYNHEFEALQKKHSNFHFIPIVSQPKNWLGEIGYVQEKLKTHISNPKNKRAYICGSSTMIYEVKKSLSEIGFSPEKINFE